MFSHWLDRLGIFSFAKKWISWWPLRGFASMVDDRQLERCVAAYKAGEFEECLRLCEDLSRQGDFPLARRLSCVCLLRSGRPDEAENLARQTLADSRLPPWDRILLELLFEYTTIEEADAQAGTPLQKCQAFFYLGAWFLAGGRPGDAINALRLSLVQNSDCIENELAKADIPAIGRMLSRYVQVQYERGKYEDAAEAASLSVYAIEIAYGNDHPGLASALNNLGLMLTTVGRHPEAEQALLRAVAIADSSGETETASYAMYLHNLAVVYHSTGRDLAARDTNEKALAIRRRVLGNDHRDVANSLNSLGVIAAAQHNFRASREFFRQALEIEEKTLPDDHLHLASTRANLAETYHSMGEYANAEDLYAKALRVRRKALGDEHPTTISNFDQAGRLYLDMGKNREAEALLQLSLQGRRHLYGEEDARVALSLNSLGLLKKRSGLFDEAERFYTKALDLRRKLHGLRHTDVAQSMSNLGLLYELVGRYTEAEPLLKQAVDIEKAIGPAGKSTIAVRLNNLGLFYMNQGKFALARTSFEEAREIDRHGVGERHPYFATRLHNLAQLTHAEGHYAEAIDLYKRAIEIRSETLGFSHADYALSLNGLASVYGTMEDPNQAIAIYQAALRAIENALGTDHPSSANILENLAVPYRQLGRPEADEMFRRAVAVRRRTLPPDHPDIGLSLQREAEHCLQTGRFDEAADLFREAGQIAEKAFGQDHSQYAAALHGEGLAASANGRPEEAIRLLSNSLERISSSMGRRSVNTALAFVDLAVAYAKTGDLDKAMASIHEATSVMDVVIARVFRAGSERMRAGFLDKISDDFHLALALIARYRANSATEVRFGYELVLRRKSLLSESLAAQRDALLENRYPSLTPALQELKDLRSQLAALSLAGPGELDPGDHESRLAKLFAGHDQAEAGLTRQIPELEIETRLRKAGPDSVADALDAGSMLLEFVRVPTLLRTPAADAWAVERYLVFVVPAQNAAGILLFDLGSASEIDGLIDEFLRSIRAEVGVRGENAPDGGTRDLGAAPRNLKNAAKDAGERLRKAIFDPVRSSLAGAARIIVAPDGDLNRLSFEALPSAEGDSGDRLIDTLCFSYEVCGRDCVQPAASANGGADALVVANPNYDLVDHGRALAESVPSEALASNLRKNSIVFRPLPETLEEGRLVAEALGVSALIRDQATVGAVRDCRSPRIIHFATHGFFLKDGLPGGKSDLLLTEPPQQETRFRPETGLNNPLLRSGLALAGANTFLRGGRLPPAAGNGLLTAEDIAGINLTNTEMAVLSACDTGIGVIRAGEGVYGLRRAFAVSGARTLVLSLWPVGDAAARLLMTKFYSRILSGEKISRAEALRQSMLAMKAQDSRPWYWAAFICQGYPGPLANTRN
jgi:tetratricopeptide (TPR) repeat protein/CHAT domain-containing protein